MSSKRAGEPLPIMGAEKMPKLTDGNTVNRIDDLDETTARVLDEVNHQINQSNLQQLEFYVTAGDEDAARQLLENQTINNLNTREGGELLWLAVEEGQMGIAGMLVRHGADLNVRKYHGYSLLHYMLHCGIQYREELFWSMIDHGADINACDNMGHSVLQDAIKTYNCSSQFVEKLLDYGARVTTNKDERINDICVAYKHKLELLPRLIQHQVVHEEMRNERAVIAIDCLISGNYTGAKRAAATRMIKEILDLGVPVNLSFSELQKRKSSFLERALQCKNKAAIKLLLECGANPHCTNLLGHTSLYQATAFKGYTHVSRWLIESGVSIHEPNRRGSYPIHGACENQSLRNLHLLLNLGADLNSTDGSGRTPFGLLNMRKTLKCKEVHHLIIKHFALIIVQGGKIRNRDIAKVNRYNWSRHHFKKCSEQLEKMKVEKIYGDISYFSLLSKNTYFKVQLMKNKNFLVHFQQDKKRRAELFPDYFHMIIHSTEVTEKRLKMLLAEKEQLREGFPEAMPDHIVEKIAYYWSFEKLERCQHEYFMSFHANLKHTQVDKAKIL